MKTTDRLWMVWTPTERYFVRSMSAPRLDEYGFVVPVTEEYLLDCGVTLP